MAFKRVPNHRRGLVIIHDNCAIENLARDVAFIFLREMTRGAPLYSYEDNNGNTSTSSNAAFYHVQIHVTTRLFHHTSIFLK